MIAVICCCCCKNKDSKSGGCCAKKEKEIPYPEKENKNTNQTNPVHDQNRQQNPNNESRVYSDNV